MDGKIIKASRLEGIREPDLQERVRRCNFNRDQRHCMPEVKPQLSETILEIGRKLHPRRYCRFKDLRPYQEACDWAKRLDWKSNPYDRFLLRREILHHLESEAFYEGRLNIYTFASRPEIAAEVDRLMNEFPDRYKTMGVFSYVLITLPGRLAFRHGIVRKDPLLAALNQTSP
jgi:hypothetical protein